MTGWGQLSLRVKNALDRLVWGLGDLKRVLMEHGAWPAFTSLAAASDGARWAVIGGRICKRPGNRKVTSLLVSEAESLRGTVQLPPMLRSSLAAAVDEALWRVSPLPPDQIVAAWDAEPNASGGWAVHWGMFKRSTRDQMLAAQGLSTEAAIFLLRQGRVIPVRDRAWQRQSIRQRWMDSAALGLLLTLLLSLSLLALMPLILKRQAVVRAVEHVNVLVPKAAPLREKMDELRRQAAVAEELRKNINIDMPLASAIEGLSVALPGDSWLDRIEINGSEIRISGLTSNATELIAHLGRQPGLAEVRATGANVRDGTLNKERFTFEMRWRGEESKP
jgi:general secretion pathway protein L